MTTDTGIGYGEAWPGGPWIHEGNLPAGLGEKLLHFRVAADGRVAGQGHDSGKARYWRGDKWIALDALTQGINIAAFHPSSGEVYVSTPDGVRIFTREGDFRKLLGGYIGSQGIRNILANGTIITGDSTQILHLGLNEYTDLGDSVLVGQGHEGGLCTYANGATRLVKPGGAYFVRANRIGDNLAICFVTETGVNIRLLTTMGELRSLPLVVEGAAPSPTPPPTQEPPKPMPTAPNKIEVVRHVIALHPEINRLKDGERGRITDLVVLELGGRPWGRKDRDRDPSNNNNSDDALCFLLNDGSFEIYDILNGGDGSATFDYKGTFKDGQNGFFRDVVSGSGGNPGGAGVPQDSGHGVPALTEADVNRFIGAAIAQALAGLRQSQQDTLGALQQLAAAAHQRLDQVEARLAKPIRSNRAGFGPLAHSHEVTI